MLWYKRNNTCVYYLKMIDFEVVSYKYSYLLVVPFWDSFLWPSPVDEAWRQGKKSICWRQALPVPHSWAKDVHRRFAALALPSIQMARWHHGSLTHTQAPLDPQCSYPSKAARENKNTCYCHGGFLKSFINIYYFNISICNY